VVDDSEQTVELKVDGMRCNGCVTSLQRTLSEISGVTGADVWLEEGRAQIRGKGLSVQELVEAATSLGFEAQSTR